MKKFFKTILYGFLFFFLLGAVMKLLESFGMIESADEMTERIEKNRQTYLTNWNKLLPYKGEFIDDTFVVYHTNKINNFKNKDDFSKQYHPKIVFGNVSCEDIWIKYIQVRSIHHNKLLSGVRCK